MSSGPRLNLLLLAQFYPPVIGGEERHVQALARGLASRGHRVTVGTLRVPNAPDAELDAGVQVVRLQGTVQRFRGLYQSDRRLAAPIPDPEAGLALRRLIAEVEPDVVHGHNWFAHSYLPFAIGRRRPFVLSLHDYGQICAKKTLIYRDETLCSGPAFEKCLRCAARHYGTVKGGVTVASAWTMAGATRELVDMFLPVSGAVADGNRLAEDRLPHRVIPNFIPDEISTSVGEPRRLDELPAPGYLLFVGAFARRKGVHILLDAYRAMESPPPLVMIGYRSSDVIESLASPPPGVLVFTDWPADAVAEAWRRASLGIVPSTWADPCPTVAIEAMAAGKPLVASALGGLVDLVDHGQTGWLVGPGDPGALAAALQLALDDPGQVAEMGAAAARKSVAFRASEVITRIEGVYRELLDARRGLDGVNGSGS